jgi:hypothetical protein
MGGRSGTTSDRIGWVLAAQKIDPAEAAATRCRMRNDGCVKIKHRRMNDRGSGAESGTGIGAAMKVEGVVNEFRCCVIEGFAI